MSTEPPPWAIAAMSLTDSRLEELKEKMKPLQEKLMAGMGGGGDMGGMGGMGGMPSNVDDVD